MTFVSETLDLTVLYEDAGDGWVLARVPQVRGAISHCETREDARDNVVDVLRELLEVRFGAPPVTCDNGTSLRSPSPREAP